MPRQTPQANPARAPRRARPHESGRTPRPAPSPARVESPPAPSSAGSEQDAELSAERALLADPARIARGPSRSTKPAPKKSTTRTRSKSPAKPVVESASPTPRPLRATALLDATRAQRLARDARQREHAMREALAQARASLATQTTPPSTPALGIPADPTPGWQRRPLGQPISAEAPATIAPQAAPRTAVPARVPTVPPAERALAAELREAKATLAIARETTQIQRDEIARLRAALAAAASGAVSASPNVSASSEGERAERVELRGRIAALEAELERASFERAELHHTMATHQQELLDRGRRQAELQERFDVLEQSLDQTRRQAELERRRHTEAQTLLERLRSALRGVEPEASDPVAVEARLDARPAAGAEHGPSPTEAVQTPRTSDARTAIFSLWLDEQVRRNFGPLGIDSVSDLLREPLARRSRSNGAPLPILLVGSGVAGEARDVAEALVRAGTAAFVLHVADRDGASCGSALDDDPLQGMIRQCAFPERAESLRNRLRELEPAVVVTRELLTWQVDVTPWLDALREASGAGTALVLLEQTGLGAVTPSAELVAIGERIWELLPERYTRDPESGAPIASFGEAFAARATPPRNALLRRLREGFELELCAQFGFLAEAFVSGPIAGCFDAGQARDQRFLKQIADVDERRLESGSAAALHLIARIDPHVAR